MIWDMYVIENKERPSLLFEGKSVVDGDHYDYTFHRVRVNNVQVTLCLGLHLRRDFVRLLSKAKVPFSLPPGETREDIARSAFLEMYIDRSEFKRALDVLLKDSKVQKKMKQNPNFLKELRALFMD